MLLITRFFVAASSSEAEPDRLSVWPQECGSLEDAVAAAREAAGPSAGGANSFTIEDEAGCRLDHEQFVGGRWRSVGDEAAVKVGTV